jgi:hypothetical protein
VAICDAAAEGADRLAGLYRFPAERGDAAGQLDLNYSPCFARQLLWVAIDNPTGELWAALMSDAAARESRIEATPLCFLFGQGHQHFLERLVTVARLPAPPARGRGRNAVVLTASETFAEALFMPWMRKDSTPGFRWDPEEDVRYALRADDPSTEKATTQHGANRLAVLGLLALTVVPVERGRRVRLDLLGGSFDPEFSFTWPIWCEAASLAAIRTMLSHPDLARGPAVLEHLGVRQVRRTRRIGVGRFMNFTRAEAIG